MRGFSKESLSKLRVLNFMMPLIAMVMSKAKSVLFLDAFSGPGQYSDPKLGTHLGSPSVLHNALMFMGEAIQRRLILIEKDVDTYLNLLKFTANLPIAPNLSTVPILGNCNELLRDLIDTMGTADHIFVFSDPCGCEIPYGLARLARKQNVTVLLRYSVTASKRSQDARLQTDLKAFDMPYWTFHPGDERGQHKYNMLLGTHDKAIAEVCSSAMREIVSPAAALSFAEPVKTKVVVTKPKIIVPTASKKGSRGGNGGSGATPPEVVAKMRTMRKAGTPRKVVAEACGVSGRTVGIYTADLVTKRGAGKAAHSRKRLTLNINEMKAMKKDGLTNAAIAKKLGVSDETIRRRLLGF